MARAPSWPTTRADVEIDTGVTGSTRADQLVATVPDGVLSIDHPGADADPNPWSACSPTRRCGRWTWSSGTPLPVRLGVREPFVLGDPGVGPRP